MANDTTIAAGPADIRRYLGAIWRQAWIVLLCVLLTAVAAAALSERRDTKYSATARLLLRSYDPARALPGVVSGFTDPTRTRASDLQLITLPPVARGVERELDLGLSPGALAGMIKTNAVGDSDIISITATTSSPFRAAQVANAFADVYVRFRRVTNRRRFAESIRIAGINLARARREGKGAATIRALSLQVDRLRLLGSLETADAQVVAHAGPDTVSVLAPKTARTAAAGALVGLLVGLLLALLRERLDDRIRREDDATELLAGVPVLGRIPRGGGRRGANLAAAFHDLRTTLEVLMPHGQRRSLLITSAGGGDGKSTIAANLALAITQGGTPDSVLLVDADLRRPELSRHLQTESGSGENGHGVSHVLAGGAGLEASVEQSTATRRMRGKGPRVALEGLVPLLAAGSPPESPETLFTQDTASSLLTDAAVQDRTVIVDGPPLGRSADMLPIAKQVTGVLVVVRLNRTRERDLQTLTDRLETAGVKPMGIVVLGAGRDSSGY